MRYELIINNGSAGKEMDFSYGHTKTAKMRVSLKGASITVELAKDYSKCFDGSYAYNLLKEGIKRAELAHILKYSKILIINSITMFVHKDSKRMRIGDIGKLAEFYSLISDNLDLPKHFGDYKLLQSILQLGKTNAGPRYSSLYSYLLSRQKSNEMEQFIYHWIAINGMYGFVGGKREYEKINNLAKQLSIGKHILSSENRKVVGPKISSLLNKICDTVLRETIEQNKYCLNQEIQTIIEQVGQKNFDMTTYGFLILDYAYYLRCKYFHAGRPVLLFCYESDIDLKALKSINSLLREFLDENMHKLFDGTLHPEN